MTKYMAEVKRDLRGISWIDEFETTDRFFADFGSLYVAAYKQHFLRKKEHTFEGMFSGMRVRKEEIEGLVEYFMTRKPLLRLIDCSYTIPTLPGEEVSLENAVMISDDHIVVLSGQDYCYIYTTENEFLRASLKHLTELFVVKPKASVNIVVTEPGGLALRRVPLEDRPLVDSNYMPKCHDQLTAVRAACLAKVPFGRLNILAGEPGTGKTSYLKSLLSDTSVKFLTVPSTYVNSLEESGLIKLILHEASEKPIVILLEDADGALVSRKNGTGDSRVCALLSALDGVLSEVLDIRVVATTNLPIDHLDAALLRPGRLAHLVHVPKLSRDQAQVVLDRLNEELSCEGVLPAGDLISLADVYAAAHGADNKANETVAKLVPQRRVGF